MTFESVNKLSILYYPLEIAFASFAINILTTLVSEPSVPLFLLVILSSSGWIATYRYRSWWDMQTNLAGRSKNPPMARQDIVNLNRMKIVGTSIFIVTVFLIATGSFVHSISGKHEQLIANELIMGDIKRSVSEQNKLMNEFGAILNGFASKINDTNDKIDSILSDTRNMMIEMNHMKMTNPGMEETIDNQ